MNVKIYYFSGTGNSLLLARKMTSKIDGAELLPAVKLYQGETSKIEAVAVGFVFPVYSLDMPDIIKTIIEKYDFSNVGYIFAAVTCGEASGNTLNSLNRILRKKGRKLDYGITVKMGDNSIVYVTSQEKLKQRLECLESISTDIATRINNKEVTEQVYKFSATSALMKPIINITLFFYYKIDRKSAIKKKCNLCGLCTNVCPVKNIKVVNRIVEWGDNCKLCFACLNWCPQKAIRFGKIDLSRKPQYRCPDICAADIMNILP